jgi:hypothetical protein
MRATRVSFLRTVNLGNYENVRLMVELEIGEGEGAAAAMDAARRFIQREARKHDPNAQDEVERWHQRTAQVQAILANQENYTLRQVREAQNWLQTHPEPPSLEDDGDPIL